METKKQLKVKKIKCPKKKQIAALKLKKKNYHLVATPQIEMGFSQYLRQKKKELSTSHKDIFPNNMLTMKKYANGDRRSNMPSEFRNLNNQSNEKVLRY